MIKIVISSLLLFISVLPAQRLTIDKPKINSYIASESMVEIEWSYFQVDGNIIISYSKNSGNWGIKEIDIVDVGEKSYSWFVPSINEYDGEIYIRITSEKDKSVNDRMSLRLPNYPTKVAKNNSVSRSTSISNKSSYVEEWNDWQKRYQGRNYSSKDVFITEPGDYRYGPGYNKKIAFKSNYGERYKYIDSIGNWYVVRSNTSNNIYFTHVSKSEVVNRGGYPKTKRKTARSSSSYSTSTASNDDSDFWCGCITITFLLLALFQ